MKKLVIFSAHWCSPCGQLKKTIQNTDLGIPVETVDIDADPTSTVEYDIRGVPTVLLMNDNQVMKRRSGYMNAEQLKEFVA